jgi:hypothetical protein
MVAKHVLADDRNPAARHPGARLGGLRSTT